MKNVAHSSAVLCFLSLHSQRHPQSRNVCRSRATKFQDERNETALEAAGTRSLAFLSTCSRIFFGLFSRQQHLEHFWLSCKRKSSLNFLAELADLIFLTRGDGNQRGQRCRRGSREKARHRAMML